MIRIPDLPRILVIVLVFYGGSWAVAAVGTHMMLDGTSWTAKQHRPPRTIAPAPEPTATKRKPEVGVQSGLLGTCAIPTSTTAVRALCGTPGSLTVVGVIDDGNDHRTPCKDTPFTKTWRAYGERYLCLGNTAPVPRETPTRGET